MRAPTAGGPGAEVTQAGEPRSARIESLRAIAALGVLLGHQFVVAQGLRLDTYWHRIAMGGGFGVDLFFALTGYLLSWPFARHWFASGAVVNVRRYALNRALRILPLYYVVVAVLLVVREGGGTSGQWWRFLTFTETFSHSTLLRVDGVVWSLVVELHFYVLLPFLAWGIAKLARRSIARAASVVVALGAASLLVQAAFVGFGSPRDEILAYALPARFYLFAGGMLLALLRLKPPAKLPRADLWLLAAAALWPSSSTTTGGRRSPCCPASSWSAPRCCRCAPARSCGRSSGGRSRWSASPPTRSTCGTCRSSTPSAAPYAEQLLVGTPICLAVAFASYRLVEAPFLRLRKRWEGSRPRFAAAAPDRTASPLPQPAPPTAAPAPRSP